MSLSAACKLPGLVGAFRSMNVRQEELEQWVLEAPIYSTKRRRTCAASVPWAVAPAPGICDSGRPARCPRAARSVGDTRKPLHRPSGALMPCFPGCLAWNDARHGGERAKTTYATSTLAISSANGTAFVASVCTGADVGLWTVSEAECRRSLLLRGHVRANAGNANRRHAGADHRP